VKGDHSLSLLDRFYVRYLDDEDSAGFIATVAKHYTVGTLERMVRCGSSLSRRGAVLALGFIGQFGSNAVLGRAMRDRDRAVRVLAENAIREVWFRDGSDSQRQQLAIAMRLNTAQQFHEATAHATQLIEEAPQFAEAWNQRAIALFHLRRFREAANDCHQTLELNSYHFGAALGMAHCYLEMSEGFAALEYFRRAFDMNPNLVAVKGQIAYLQRALRE
jgi:tetratricopeptide (TPR) repeat protein